MSLRIPDPLASQQKLNQKEPGITIRDFFSFKGSFSLKKICIMGMMLALATALSYFTISPLTTFKLFRITYLPGVVVACLCGPWASIAYGLLADTLTFIAHPQGGYFPGYAISEMVTCFLYSCFLYKRRNTSLLGFLLRACLSRVAVILIVFLGLNFIWQRMMMGSTAAGFYSVTRLLNNLIQLPLHTLLITYAGRFAFLLEGKTFRQLSTYAEKD